MSHQRNSDFLILYGVIINMGIGIIIIIGSSFANALSKSSSINGINSPQNSAGIGNLGSLPPSNSVSNLTHFNNQSSVLPSGPARSNSTSVSSNNKVVMINFDDGYKSQIRYAKPILDKYGFKASFFIVCGKVATQPDWLNWQDIASLKKDGMDIESHTMTHAHLNTLVKMPSQLSYEIEGSKQYLASHGYNATIFGYPNNLGSNIPSVVNMVAKYYNLGRSGTDPLMFLNCSGYAKDPQTDCQATSAKGKITHANRYDIRSASFYHISSHHNLTPPEMFQVFLQIVNSQTPYNLNGKINAIPVIVYHNLTNSIQDYTLPIHASSTTVDLFAREMKYLHDSGFKVLTMNQLGYDTTNNVFYVKNVPSPTSTTTTNTSAETAVTNAATMGKHSSS